LTDYQLLEGTVNRMLAFIARKRVRYPFSTTPGEFLDRNVGYSTREEIRKWHEIANAAADVVRTQMDAGMI
jgi:hypothetical protein